MTAPGDVLDALEAELQAGLGAFGLDADPEQRRRLVAHLRLIERWNRVYNLTAIREPAAMVVQHTLDSLALVQPLRRYFDGSDPAAGRRRLLDVGSGAGLPGVVIAIMEPDLDVTCVDAVAKKAGFVRQAGIELGLHNLQAVHARVEDLPTSPAFDIVTARAFASLSDLVELTRPLLAADGAWAAMKGALPQDEITALPPDVAVFHVEPLAVPGLDARRCLIWMKPRSMDA